MIQVTEAKVNLIPEPKGSLRAFAQITIDGSFVVKGIRVVDGSKGLFVGMPQTQSKKDGEYYDQAFPITKEARDHITDSILEEYAAKVGGGSEAPVSQAEGNQDSDW